jgi:hypothetical protein
VGEVGLTKLEDDAAEFACRKSGAERVRRYRERKSRGISGEIELTIQVHLPSLVHLYDGNTGRPRTIVDIEKAAELMVSEENRSGLRLRKYRESTDIAGYSPEEPAVLPTIPPEANEAA